jgi:RNA polymerase sigma-B factor
MCSWPSGERAFDAIVAGGSACPATSKNSYCESSAYPANWSASSAVAPTVAELAERANVTSERVLEALQATTAHHAFSLDQPRADSDEPQVTGRELAVDEPGFGAVEDAAMLDGLLCLLPERDREILMLRFRDDLLQWQIAEIVGISQMQVSRVISRSICRLQRAGRS